MGQLGFFDREERTAKLTQMGGHIVRTIGPLRAEVKIGMMNLVYNRVRLGHKLRRDRRGAPCGGIKQYKRRKKEQ